MTADGSAVDLGVVRAAVNARLRDDDQGPVRALPTVRAAGRLLRDVLGPPPGPDAGDTRAALTAVGDLYLCRAASDADGTGLADLTTALACAALVDADGSGGRVGRVVALFGDELGDLLPPAAWVEVANDAYGSGEAGDLTSVSLLRLALTALPSGDPRRVAVATNISGQLIDTHDPGLLDDAVTVCAAVAAEHPHDPVTGLTDLLSNQALALASRYEGAGGSLDEAVAVARRAVAAAGPGDDGTAWSTLSLVLRLRAEFGGSDLDAAEAVEAAGRATGLAEQGSARWALRRSNAASALRTRYDLIGDPATLAGAVRAIEEVVAVHPTPASLVNAGVMRFAAYDRDGDPADLAAALEAFERAHEAGADEALLDPNWALALQASGRLTGDLAAIRRAASLSAAVLDRLPAGAPARPAAAAALLDVQLTRAETGDEAGLLDAVRRAEQEVRDTPPGHGDLPSLLSTLSVAVRESAERSGSAGDLTRAVDLARRAVDLVPADHPDQRVYASNLSAALLAHADRTGAPEPLHEAVEAAERAVRAAAGRRAGAGPANTNLALARHTRYQRLARPEDLDAAIGAARAAERATPPTAVARAGVLSNLSLVLRGLPDDTLTEAVEAAAEAVRLTPPSHPDRPGYLSNLGLAHADLAERTGDPEHLRTAVARAREAVDEAPPGHPGRAGFLSNLGNVLQDRYQRLGAADDLTAAIEAKSRAVRATPAEHPDRVRYLVNLSGALHAHYERTGAQESLEAAVEAARTATRSLGGAPEAGQAVAFYSLSNALQALHARRRHPVVLREAVEAARAGAARVPGDHPLGPMLLSGLAAALQFWYLDNDDLGALDEAVTHLRRAVELTPADHPDAAARLSNLSVALDQRHQRTGDRDSLTDAVGAARRATQLMAGEHPDRATAWYVLGNALETLHGPTLDPGGITAAVTAFRTAALVETAPSTLRVRAAAAWGRLAAATGDVGEGLAGLSAAVTHLAAVPALELDRASQEALLAQFAGIASDAAVCAADRGQAEQAAVLLENGRGMLLAALLDARTDLTELRARHPELADRYAGLRRSLEAAPVPRTGPQAGPVGVARRLMLRRAQVDDLRSTIEEIRGRPGFDGFLDPPEAGALTRQAGAGPVVLVAAGSLGGCAVIVTSGGIRTVELAGLDAFRAGQWARDFYRAVTAAGRDAADPGHPAARAILGELWDVVADPVLDALPPAGRGGEVPRVWWSAAGALGLLPLHAAGHHDRPGRSVLDRVVSSYTPTVRALAHARREAAPDGPTLAGPGNGPVGEASLLVVPVPRLPGRAPLPGARAETQRLRQLFGAAVTVLASQDARRDEVLAELPRHDRVHFACHAVVADPRHPSEGALELADSHVRPLTVADVTGLRLTGELAYLSACSTANAGEALADESIHLASAFQLAGYRHVIGTLWPVPDGVARRVAGHVYEGVRASSAQAAPRALHDAVRALRERYRDRPALWAAHVHSGA